MLIKLKQQIRSDALALLVQKLSQHGMHHCISQAGDATILGLEQKPAADLLGEIQAMECVEAVMPIATPFKMASKAFKPNRSTIKIKDIEIGGDQIIMMAGPCAIESEEQLLTIARQLKNAKVSVLRGSAFKPRTSPYSFQGMGIEGLKIHKRAQLEHGLVIETEVMDVRDVGVVAEHVDIVRIGARNMQNFNLLKEVGQCGKPVILKRGMSATVEEWLMSAEYIMAHGNEQVILCERGIRTFENSTRSTLDLSSVAVAKGMTHLPIIVDPSHAAGRKDIIPALSKASVALGADGLLVEVHHLPAEAKCDGKQALLPHELAQLSTELNTIAQAIGRHL
ncbi:MAG: 3-deoxy-7-phosphoheptulonate synthase [Parachlamydiales bacterium]|nr:3-deoxy-7-phosphoheptulonate synthase [Verrucomicrobiota bacterium]MBX3719819.1 3-deoxy-7-phosphoheptulonate synthase [Candidatus Acheromyda pituitae]